MTRVRSLIHTLRVLGQSTRGTAAVELALVLPFLVLLAIGVSDLGRLFFTGITVANAARAGAQYGSWNIDNSKNTTQIDLVAQNEAADLGAVTVSSRSFCRCDAGEVADCTVGNCGAYGEYRVYVEVTVSKAVNLLFNYPGFSSPVIMSRTATFRVQ